MSVEAYLATVKRMIEWAIRDVNALISTVDMSDPDGARDALQAELPTLIAVWGEVAATAAAEYFEELVGSPAVLADSVEPAAIESMVGWAVGPLYGELRERTGDDGEPILDDFGNPIVDKIPPDPAKARRNLQGASQRNVLDTGRNTIQDNAISTPGIGWARILQGEQDCAFCVTLAGRGAVFESKETATSNTLRKDALGGYSKAYHDFCDCAVIPIASDSDWPPGYDHEKYENMYYEARKKAGVMTLKGGTPGKKREDVPLSEQTILQVMRSEYGLH